MKKILLPIDGSERSLRSAEQAVSLYKKEDVEIVLLTVRSDCAFVKSESELAEIQKESLTLFKGAKEILEGYKIKEQVKFGLVGDTILKSIGEENISVVIMTRSTRAGSFKNMGSITSYVIKYAKCLVVIVPEFERLMFNEPNGTVQLVGQSAKGADSCLLPLAVGKNIYEISVREGKIRLTHLAYNPDGGTWSLPPQDEQNAYYQIEAGETRKIELIAGTSFGYEDRVELINPSLREPVIAEYRYWTE